MFNRGFLLEPEQAAGMSRPESPAPQVPAKVMKGVQLGLKSITVSMDKPLLTPPTALNYRLRRHASALCKRQADALQECMSDKGFSAVLFCRGQNEDYKLCMKQQ